MSLRLYILVPVNSIKHPNYINKNEFLLFSSRYISPLIPNSSLSIYILLSRQLSKECQWCIKSKSLRSPSYFPSSFLWKGFVHNIYPYLLLNFDYSELRSRRKIIIGFPYLTKLEVFPGIIDGSDHLLNFHYHLDLLLSNSNFHNSRRWESDESKYEMTVFCLVI